MLQGDYDCSVLVACLVQLAKVRLSYIAVSAERGQLAKTFLHGL